MDNRSRIGLVPVLAALLLSAACAQPEAAAAPEMDAADQLAANARKSLLENTGDDRAKPAFTKETVIKLNAIVRRSLDAMDTFDDLVPELASAKASGDSARAAAITKQMGELEATTIAARAEFATEKEALLARKEEHNKIVLDAMEQFVVEAPGEIAEAIAQQAK